MEKENINSSIKSELEKKLNHLKTENEKSSLDEFSQEKLDAALSYIEKHKPNVYNPSPTELRETRPSLNELRLKFKKLAGDFDDEKYILSNCNVDLIFCRKTLDRLCQILLDEQNTPIWNLKNYLKNRNDFIEKMDLPSNPKEVKDKVKSAWEVLSEKFKYDPESEIGKLLNKIEEENKKDV